MYLILTASKDTYITNKIISNTLTGAVRASTSITIAGGALNVNVKITLISTDLTSISYLGITEGHGTISNGDVIAIGDNPDGQGVIEAGDERIDMIAFQVGADATDAADMLKESIDSTGGHNLNVPGKKIIVESVEGKLTLTQTTTGNSGNQDIVITGDTSSRITPASPSFTGGVTSAPIRATDANVGRAGTIDIFKLYGENQIGDQDTNIELSRGLIKFEYDTVTPLMSKNLNVGADSFKAYLHLKDVTTGRATPSNVTFLALPLSKSFDEGIGRSVSTFNDLDVSNFVEASYTGGSIVKWDTEGANKSGQATSANAALTDTLDVMTSIVARDGGNNPTEIDMKSYFELVEGTEDVIFNVTSAVSASLKNDMQNHGFRISLDATEEGDTNTYFIKRFGSRHVRNANLRPELHLLYDDSLLDRTLSPELNIDNTVYLSNYNQGAPANIISGSVVNHVHGNAGLTTLAGDNCLNLILSKSKYQKVIPASQILRGTNSQGTLGVYGTTFNIDTFTAASTLHDGKNATTTLTILDGALDVNVKITLVSNDVVQTSRTYLGITEGHATISNGDVIAIDDNPDGLGVIVGGDARIGMIAFQVGSSAADAATMLKAAVNNANGHNTKITIADSGGGQLTLTQETLGVTGNTPITILGDTSARITLARNTPSFEGGADVITLEEVALASGSIEMDMLWTSLDKTVVFNKKKIMISTGSIGSHGHGESNPVLKILNLNDRYGLSDSVRLRVFTFDHNDTIHPPSKLPYTRKAAYIGDLYWQLVDETSSRTIISFQIESQATRLSTDEDGYYFDFNMGSVPVGAMCRFEFARKIHGKLEKIHQRRLPRFKVL